MTRPCAPAWRRRFLPLFGPLPGDATTVPADILTLSQRSPTNGKFEVERSTLRSASRRVAVNVFVKNHMLADPELAAASIMFRRAANIIARVEDAVIFSGRLKDTDPRIRQMFPVPPAFL